jgi:hypothetical protein
MKTFQDITVKPGLDQALLDPGSKVAIVQHVRVGSIKRLPPSLGEIHARL